MSSILVVEDERSTRQLLTEMLKTAGFSVTSAKDGVDALKRVRAGSYDLMLLDVWMPKMNGSKMAMRARSCLRYLHVRCLPNPPQLERTAQAHGKRIE
jgi:CheY-like chemotaxis protein